MVPEVLTAFDQMSSAGFDMMRHSPMYKAWSEVAPDPDAFPALMDKTGDLLRLPYDWTEEVKSLKIPTQLVYGDSDSIPTSHVAEFYTRPRGWPEDPGWDGSDKTAMRLAILPSLTHYDVFYAPQLAQVVADFIS